MNIRKEARGRGCQIRLPGCTGGGEDTVLAHYRLAGYCGTGLKPPDHFGAFACHHCHDVADGRRTVSYHTRNDIRLAHAEGVLRTFDILKREGKA